MTERHRMERVGDLIPAAARRLGLEDELRLARAVATWAAIVEERAPAASGSSRVVTYDARTLTVEAADALTAQELRIRTVELVGAFRSAPGGGPVDELRIAIRRV